MTLQVRDVMPVIVGAVGGAGSLDGIERLAHRAVPDRVEMHLEARRVQAGHDLAQVFRVDIGQAASGGLAAARVEVRVDHPGGEILSDAILHDLHCSP
jgi:hypothetical protein